MPIIDSQDTSHNQGFNTHTTMDSDWYGFSRSNVSALHDQAMLEKTWNKVPRTNANRVGPEGFAGEDEFDLGSEIVSKDASLVERLSSVREGLLDVLNIEYPFFSTDELKEIQGMVSSLGESIAAAEDADRNKKMQEVNGCAMDGIDFASGNINGGFLGGDKSKNEGLSSLPPLDIPEENVPDSLPSPDYVPNSPPSPEYVPDSPPSPDSVPNSPPSREYVPISLPSPTYASPVEKEFGTGYWEFESVCPIHPYEIDAYKAVLDYQKKFGPSSLFSRMTPDIPEDYVPDRLPSPNYTPNSLPSPTYASPFEKKFGTGYWRPKPEWPIRFPKARSSEDGDDNGKVPSFSKKHDNHDSGCTKRKAADDGDSDCPALKVKRSRTELADSRITFVPRVMATTGGWLEEWVMTGTGGWLED